MLACFSLIFSLASFYDQNLSDMDNKARNAHFEHGSSEHLGENVVSLAAFARKKASRKPEGY